MPPASPSPSPASGSPASGAPDACTQPGCSGTIVDGYCDECGSAAAPPSPPAVQAPAAPGTASAPPDDKCHQPDCSGTIVDGYCDECGSPPDQPSASTGTNGTTRTGSTRTGSSRSSGRRGMLGEGLVEVPRVPYRDPSSAVMSDPQVAEGKRYCSNCGEPVGRGRPGRPGRTEGFCPKCGTGFSFTPKLASGDLVANQYRVLGCIAHGGLGWIYLAQDERVSNRWVVLKGLLDTGDADARIAAEAERAYLAAVDHPNIVKIYNFVEHDGDDYIVMQYVGGRSLKDILLEQPQPTGEKHLPLPQAIAYALEVLRAFDYLHANGLVYCDFKPDNVIQSEEELKLIDLGGVRRLDDQDGAIYGTIGYQAPEIADEGPSVSSDLYTVGRTLAVLSFPFKGYTRAYAESLPPREEVPLLQRFESYDRFLRRATHREPAERFQDAAEMAEQLTGVLREVLAAEEGAPRPAPSGLFGPERFGPSMAGGPAGGPAAESALPPVPPPVAAAALPVPLVDGSDSAAAFLAGLTALDDEQLGPVLENAPERTPEVMLALARVKIETGRAGEAPALLDELARSRPGDWRVDWFRAVALLAEGRVAEAEPRFDRLYGLLPGEAAPKLALAYCREHSAPDEAVRLFELVWRTDHGYLTAAFGQARVHLAAGRRAAALEALDAVPEISIWYVPAQVAAVATAVRGREPADLTAAELVAAGERLAGLDLDDDRRDRLAAEILEAALDWLPAGSGNGAQGGALMGAPLAETPLRRRLERTYRELARRSRDRGESRLLIDSANAVRPRTLL
ncbi:protein kinase [Actinomadura sp. LD22]|uniref:non-specific serine/threonine protein kinase n=1 Tax=Actinomadura physcomitrii TaxID=2650748 RepID=A0A6I4M5Q9_9ACTN|nr:serine/threonine-protein kinase [Actinomadura physcomitrii]MVZ99476.1 protein kinase [Actinomadura physcomitrii]